jgi:hypothetical protein
MGRLESVGESALRLAGRQAIMTLHFCRAGGHWRFPSPMTLPWVAITMSIAIGLVGVRMK